tara:strand:- start:545 stop:1240 length:696 start_codon:yes stop_codon:yes gene_type:complete
MIKTKKKITALIPARSGSKGIINKNISNLNNHPLIYWTIKSAMESKYINKVVVSTDSNKIAKISKKIGATVPGIRPKKLSKDNSTTESVIDHYLNYWSEMDDIIILLQPTSPIRNKKTIDDAIKKFIVCKYDSLLSISKVKNNFFWKIKRNTSIPLYNINKRLRRQDMNDSSFVYYENGSIYIFEASKFLKFNNRLFGKIGSIVLDKYESIDIDDKDDLNMAKSIFSLNNL